MSDRERSGYRSRLGARPEWRVDRDRLEAFVDELHEETARWGAPHPDDGVAAAELRLAGLRPLPDDAEAMTTREAAELIGVTRQSINHLMQSGRRLVDAGLPHPRSNPVVSGRQRVRRTDVPRIVPRPRRAVNGSPTAALQPRSARPGGTALVPAMACSYDLAGWTAIAENRRIHDRPGRAGRTLHSRGAV